MAAGFAAALAPTYAPELRLTAAAIGGLPANLQTMAQALWHSHHPAFGIPSAVAFGLEREYGPQLPLSSELNAAGRVYRQQMNDACVNQILALGAGHSVDDFATSTDLYFSPDTQKVMAENSLEDYDGHPNIPIYEWHSPTDPLIPVADLDRTMQNWRAAGTSVVSAASPAPEHLTAAAAGLLPAVGWLFDRVRTEAR